MSLLERFRKSARNDSETQRKRQTEEDSGASESASDHRLRAFPKRENASLTLIQGNRCVYWSENRKILKFLPQNRISGGNFMRRIDCAHSRSLERLLWPWFRGISTCWIFALIHTLIFLNQGQESVFKLRERAQSILRMKLPPEIWFWERNFKIFRLSLQYTHLFPWIRTKKAFLRFSNARNPFFA